MHMVQTSNIRRTLVDKKLVDHLNVFGASPVALLQPYLHSRLNTWLQLIGQLQLQDKTLII